MPLQFRLADGVVENCGKPAIMPPIMLFVTRPIQTALASKDGESNKAHQKFGPLGQNI
jgi:hypothetical protein